MRLMGKREIGQLQPFELAISIMIADLASLPMTETGVPISNGIIPILGLLVMHLVISMLNMKSTKIREIICGKPSILIFRGKIDEEVLKRERFTINELEERLRDNNIFNIGDVAMITDVYEEERKIGSLHEKIKDKVKIPDELRDYLKFKTTPLQGLFLDYYSNGGINNYIENSKAHFAIFIVAYDDFGRYRGDLLQMFIWQDEGGAFIRLEK